MVGVILKMKYNIKSGDVNMFTTLREIRHNIFVQVPIKSNLTFYCLPYIFFTCYQKILWTL